MGAETTYKFKVEELRELAEELRGGGDYELPPAAQDQRSRTPAEVSGGGGDYEASDNAESTVESKFAQYDPKATDDGMVLKLPKKEKEYKFKIADLRELAKQLSTGKGESGTDGGGDYEASDNAESNVESKFAQYDPKATADGMVLKLPKKEEEYKFKIAELRELAKQLSGKNGD